MITLLLISGILLAVAFSGFFSGIETAAYSVNTIHLHASANEGNRSALRVLKMMKNMPRLITTMLIGTNLAIFIATNLLINFFAYNNIKNAELLTTLILTPFCFIFAESLPKRIAFKIPDKSMLMSARLILICEFLFYPVAIVLSAFGSVLQYILDRKGVSGNELIGKIRLYENLEAKTAEGKISSDQYQMARRVMEHEQVCVTELMLNPLETFTVEESQSAREAGVMMRENGYARALITNRFKRFTGRIITINSIMNNEDKLSHAVTEISETAMLLDRQTPILTAISSMRKASARIAIVTSRNGHFIGSVHFNTLINSIVHGMNEG